MRKPSSTINANGQIAGISQNGSIDPSTGWPEADAVLWQDGRITNLGTLGGTQSAADDVNDEGQAVGAALNGTFDPFANNPLLACVFYPPLGPGGCYTFTESFLFSAPATTETHAFVWTKARGMQDLGTLGGPDTLTFGVSVVGTTSSPQVETLTNTGGLTAVCQRHDNNRDQRRGLRPEQYMKRERRYGSELHSERDLLADLVNGTGPHRTWPSLRNQQKVCGISEVPLPVCPFPVRNLAEKAGNGQ